MAEMYKNVVIVTAIDFDTSGGTFPSFLVCIVVEGDVGVEDVDTEAIEGVEDEVDAAGM